MAGKALFAGAMLALVAAVNAQYLYGGYGYGLRGVGGYYGYPSTGYGYSYPYSYGYWGRKLMQSQSGATPPMESMESMEVDASLCPLSIDEDAELKQALQDLGTQCTAEKAMLGEDQLADFCSACVVPGQTALAKAAFQFIKKKEKELGNDPEAIRSAVAPLRTSEGEKACGKMIVDFLAMEGVPIDADFTRKAFKCGSGFDERKECIFDAEEDARLAEIADTCSGVVSEANQAKPETVQKYCQSCYWPLVGFSIGAILRDSPVNEPTELKCALKDASKQYTGPDAKPGDAELNSERRLADALYQDQGYIHCANNAVAAVKLFADVEPFGDANVRELMYMCWQGENRPLEDSEMLDTPTQEKLDELECPPSPSNTR